MEIKEPKINLFIVGAAKSGTTSLYNYLKQHSEIFFPKVKEPNYYSNIESENPRAYLMPKQGKFHHQRIIRNKEVYYELYKEAKGEKIMGDASPSYLWDSNAASKIHKDNPDAKILIVLRDPVIRAFSHYLMNVKTGTQESRDFREAILKDRNSPSKIWGKDHLYIELGLYYSQIKIYMDIFGNKQVKVIIYESLFRDIKKSLIDIFNFLEVDANEINNVDFEIAHNSFSFPKNKFYRKLIQFNNSIFIVSQYIPDFFKNIFKKKMLKEGERPKLNQNDYDYVYENFREDIKMTEKLLDISLSNWKNVEK